MRRSINRWFGVVVIAALAAAPAAASDRSRKLSPSNNPATWFTDSDYPPAAKRANEQGAVRFEVTVGPDGKPESCRILESSNSQALDDKTCELVMERATFQPELDADGKAIRGTYSVRTRWVLRDGVLPPLGGAWRHGAVMRIDRNGQSASCVDDPDVGTSWLGKGNTCGAVTKLDRDTMLIFRGGSLAGSDQIPVAFELSFVPDGMTAPPMAYQREGRIKISLQVVHFDLDAQGKVSNCQVVESVFSENKLCEGLPTSFVVPAGGPRGVTFIRAISRAAEQ